MVLFAFSPLESEAFLCLRCHSSALASPVCRTMSAFLGTDLHQLLVGEGQADTLCRNQEKNHPFLLRGSLRVAEMWDTSGLRRPNEGTP